MSDLAKCAGVGCSIREHCLRFTRPAVDNQQWIEPALFFFSYNRSSLMMVTDPTKGVNVRSLCWDHQPLPVEPHGGAQEEGDGA